MFATFTTTLAEVLAAVGSADVEVQVTLILSSALNHADAFTRLLVLATSQEVRGSDAGQAADEGPRDRVRQVRRSLRSGRAELGHFVQSFEETFQIISLGLDVFANNTAPEAAWLPVASPLRPLDQEEPEPAPALRHKGFATISTQVSGIMQQLTDTAELLESGIEQAAEAVGHGYSKRQESSAAGWSAHWAICLTLLLFSRSPGT